MILRAICIANDLEIKEELELGFNKGVELKPLKFVFFGSTTNTSSSVSCFVLQNFQIQVRILA